MSHVLITGATGMVGKGVLLSCLKDDSVTKITLLTRRSSGISNPKVKELLLSDFSNMVSIQTQLEKVDACFHCMGISSLGVSKEEFELKTFVYTQLLADICHQNNPDMTFCYVSGTGTSSAENSRQLWANIKGKTENYLIQKGFNKVFLFRPGLILPEDGIQSATSWYNIIYNLLKPLYPIFKKMKSVTTTSRIGAAMLASLRNPILGSAILHNRQINALARD